MFICGIADEWQGGSQWLVKCVECLKDLENISILISLIL
jgi:hypothetical protein